MQPAAGSSSFHQLCFQQRPHLARLLQQLSVLALVQTAGANGELPLLADYNCRQLKTMDATHNSESACYCYIPHGVIHLKNIWSTIQVKINSTEMFKVMSIPEEHNCQNYEHLFAFLKCLINSIWQSDVSNETIISVGQYGDKTCFRVQPRNNVLYTVTAHQNRYCLIVGFVSFAICYKHGPLNSEQSMNLLMWMLQVTGLVFIYIGIAIPEVAYAVIVAMVCSKILHYPLRVFCYVGRKANQLFKSEKIEIRYLTEDEYREQSETETVKALEELRTFCRSPNFPSWIAVVKLQSPQKFANFVLGLPHVSPEETTAHEEQYGIGGALLEQQLFNLESEAESDHQTIPFQEEENSEEEEHRQQQNTVHFHSRELF
ncbi:nuclear envelope integral membrane protein 2 isoform X6 [Rhineura floridana]|uniref:nuclear envelope integral membrane protein 2 isoform X6 n=1 Tax=Rhineura floridana TaxID=261503 RepID=UPI002AC80962|nr:nuclear envelope integral membrane protein 2 isoform X6 [Rhineura floridana]